MHPFHRRHPSPVSASDLHRASRRGPVASLLLALWLVASGSADAQPACDIVAITDTGEYSGEPTLEGDLLVFVSMGDLVGHNADHNLEAFAADLSTTPPTFVQISDSVGQQLYSTLIDTDGRRVVFESNADLVAGQNADGNSEIFLWDPETGSLTQLTHTTSSNNTAPAIDGDRVVFSSQADLLGTNPGGTYQAFVLDLASHTLEQLTHAGATQRQAFPVDVAGDLVAMGVSDVVDDKHVDRVFVHDLATSESMPINDHGAAYGGNIDGDRVAFRIRSPSGFDLFLHDPAAGALRQLTDTPDANEISVSLQGGFAAFGSPADLVGSNADGSHEVFLLDLETDTVYQVTDSSGGASTVFVSLSGDRIAFESSAAIAGTNADGSHDVFLATCTGLVVPPPPPGPWLTSPAVPGFRFKVEIAPPGGSPRPGVAVPKCIPDTLCVSGALPGRSEVFLRVVGPKPNGRLWPTLVKFTTSKVDVWVEQESSGELKHYRLAGADGGSDLLPGLFDRDGFAPAAGSSVAAAGLEHGASPVDLAAAAATDWFTSPHFPGFRFRVAIHNGGVGSPRVESQCIAETVCLSGAVPGRSELFLRIVGPKPNGYLWPTLVRFSTSPIEVWVEQLDSGVVRHYHLPGATLESDELNGLFDRTGFLP